jgi:hypothetical protein
MKAIFTQLIIKLWTFFVYYVKKKEYDLRKKHALWAYKRDKYSIVSFFIAFKYIKNNMYNRNVN